MWGSPWERTRLLAPVRPSVWQPRPPCLSAGLLAKKAVEAGLRVQPYIRTSLAPGSGMVTHYLSASGVLPYLRTLG